MSDPRRIQTRALRDFLRWPGGASSGASTLETAGVTAAIVPATPERSVVNSVAYEDPAALVAALAEGRERGLRTSSLQSSAQGQPVYERLGYRPHFRLHMHERRG